MQIFIKMFWKTIGSFVFRSLNEAFKCGKLSLTQIQAIITRIAKGDKSRFFIQNWRPLNLLNTVYKIASGVIAKRFKLFMDTLIHNDQTGSLKGDT